MFFFIIKIITFIFKSWSTDLNQSKMGFHRAPSLAHLFLHFSNNSYFSYSIFHHFIHLKKTKLHLKYIILLWRVLKHLSEFVFIASYFFGWLCSSTSLVCRLCLYLIVFIFSDLNHNKTWFRGENNYCIFRR